MRAYCLTCELTPESSDLVQAAWYGLGMLGCEEETVGGKIRLKSYFANSASLHTAEFYLMDLNPSQPIVISVVKDEDWNAKWKQSMKPVMVVPDIWVSPGWLRPPATPGQKWIKIEPKMAFGTGHHETTRLAGRALSGIKNSSAIAPSVLDIGTGSGILCFVSDCLGFSRALGVDADLVCLANLAENRRKNRTKALLSFAIGSIDMLKKNCMFDIIVMNMISSQGEPLLDSISRMIQPGGHFVWSGLLVEEKKDIVALAAKKDFLLLTDAKENEWWCATFCKTTGS